jgi:hypothetical protein
MDCESCPALTPAPLLIQSVEVHCSLTSTTATMIHPIIGMNHCLKITAAAVQSALSTGHCLYSCCCPAAVGILYPCWKRLPATYVNTILASCLGHLLSEFVITHTAHVGGGTRHLIQYANNSSRSTSSQHSWCHTGCAFKKEQDAASPPHTHTQITSRQDAASKLCAY